LDLFLFDFFIDLIDISTLLIFYIIIIDISIREKKLLS